MKLKNKIIMIVISMLLLILIPEVKAMTEEEFDNLGLKQVYVVGDYMYDISTYNPNIKDLMLAARTYANDSDLEMIEVFKIGNVFQATSLLSSETLSKEYFISKYASNTTKLIRKENEDIKEVSYEKSINIDLDYKETIQEYTFVWDEVDNNSTYTIEGIGKEYFSISGKKLTVVASAPINIYNLTVTAINNSGVKKSIKFLININTYKNVLSKDWFKKTNLKKDDVVVIDSILTTSISNTYEYNDILYTKERVIDVSDEESKNLLLTIYKSNENKKVLVFNSNKQIYLPKYSSNLFNDFNYLKYFNGKNFDTSQVKDMSSMFYEAGYNAPTFNLDLSTWNTSQVINMSSMFYKAGNSAPTFNLDLSKWNTSQVTDMSSMFSNAGYSATTFNLDISTWDTSQVTDMSTMFYKAGENATTYNLDLSTWNTSQVKDMSTMFSNAGYSATTFNLDLSTWDTSQVKDMSSMFYNAGYSATTFNLDLSTWDTSQVTDMSSMFYEAGYNAKTYNLDLSKWNTSQVTDMSYMFVCAGENAKTFNLDLSKWDTSQVTDMSYMFYNAGENATTFNLDLSTWDTSQVTDMSYMFVCAGYNATNYSLNIKGFNLGASDSVLTSYAGIFNLIYNNVKIYVGSSTARDWVLSRRTDWATDNVMIIE